MSWRNMCINDVSTNYERWNKVVTDKELNEMIDWCRKKISNLPYNYTGKRKEGYKDAMLQVMSYLHSKKGSEER